MKAALIALGRTLIIAALVYVLVFLFSIADRYGYGTVAFVVMLALAIFASQHLAVLRERGKP